MPTNKPYRKYVICRTGVKVTSYETINTGRRKKAVKTSPPPKPMTEQALDTAYSYRQRAKRESLIRLADVNFVARSSVSVTLTFRENLRDYDRAVSAFKSFTKRVRRKLDDLRYIATLETQERGAYHFHLIVNCATVQFALDNLAPCWQNGIIDIKSVVNVKGLMLYITKDMVLQTRQHPLYKRRCYFLSQGLEEVAEITTWNSAVAELEMVDTLLKGKKPTKGNAVNSTKAGVTEYADYYFATGHYKKPIIARRKP